MRFTLLLVLLTVANCEMTPKQARREVIDMGYSYGRADFAKCVTKADTTGLRLFLLAGMDPNTTTSGYSMLEHADGDADIIEQLLQAGADANGGGGVSTPLIKAVEGGSERAIQALLQAGAQPDLADGTGRTPLMAAASRGDETSARLLLSAGADASGRSRLGATALSLAQREGHAELVELLRQAGATTSAGPNIEALMDPESLTEQAPDQYRVSFQTSAGDFQVDVNRTWAPIAADRFFNLVSNGFFADQRFFRVVRDRLVQFGLHGQPDISGRWYEAGLKDDPVQESNTLGTLSFASGGQPNSRTTQIFINLSDNADLDNAGLVPFGRIVEGLQTLSGIHDGYGEIPEQERILSEGNEYLQHNFPELDVIKQVRLAQ